jgi:hypothetical protein
VPNLVSVKLSADGKVSFRGSAASVDVIADVVGFHAAAAGPAGGRLVSVSPERLYDSRTDAPYTTGYDEACFDIPTDGVDALTLNVTAVDADQPGWVSIYSLDAPWSGTSSLNVASGAAVPNMVVVKPDADGCVGVVTSIDSVDLIFDLTGAYLTDGEFTFTSVAPVRVLDTRFGTGAPATPAGPGHDVVLSLAGRVPPGTFAVMMNVTVTETKGPGYVTVWPDGDPKPFVSSLNFTAGQTVPNLVLVPVGADGSVRLSSTAGTQLIADLAGYY